MREAAVFKTWRGYIEKAGLYSHRIENAGVSLPDSFMIYKGITIWQEFKVKTGPRLYTTPFQLVSFKKLAERLPYWAFQVVVSDIHDSSTVFYIYPVTCFNDILANTHWSFKVDNQEGFVKYLNWLDYLISCERFKTVV